MINTNDNEKGNYEKDNEKNNYKKDNGKSSYKKDNERGNYKKESGKDVRVIDAKKYILGLLQKTRNANIYVLVRGAVGSGKTEFIKKTLESLTNEAVSSPTYSYINKYQTTDLTSHKWIFHIDMYKLKSIDAKNDMLEVINEHVENEKGIFFVEWPSSDVLFSSLELGQVILISMKEGFKCQINFLHNNLMTENKIKRQERFDRDGFKSDFSRDRGGRSSFSRDRGGSRGRDGFKSDYSRDRDGSRDRGGRGNYSSDRGNSRGRDGFKKDFSRDRDDSKRGNYSRSRNSGDRRDNKSSYGRNDRKFDNGGGGRRDSYKGRGRSNDSSFNKESRNGEKYGNKPSSSYSKPEPKTENKEG